MLPLYALNHFFINRLMHDTKINKRIKIANYNFKLGNYYLLLYYQMKTLIFTEYLEIYMPCYSYNTQLY